MKEIKTFGCYIQKLREKKGLTKAHIEKLTGVSERTLRRMELNKVVPRIETLEAMSLVFKEDLVLEFIKISSEDMELYEKIKQELEEKIKENNFNGLTEDVARLKRLIKKVENPYYELKFQQYILLIEGIQVYRNEQNYPKSMEIFTKGIIISNESFSINCYQNFSYSSLELRLLMNIAFVFNKTGDREKYLEILDYLMDEIDENELIYPFVVHNLSTAYKRVGKYDTSIELAMIGIDYCKRESDCTMLPLFYYGKGVSEYYLNQMSYKDSFKKAVITADLVGLDYLKQVLEKKCKNNFKYNVSEEIEIFFEK